MLAGKVIFITGATRGIGKSIALRAAKDGALISIAAKTLDPHPKLPGTLHSVAEEIKNCGGDCLPCVVDIRNDQQVQDAVAATVSKFGKIDILVNNASAINLAGTVQTSMKSYDLMNSINARGTYLCSQICIPHLIKSAKVSGCSHILNISPPLNMKPMWFKNHVAYTTAKYGMSLCVLGMSEEFRDEKVAVNALWPKTAILTAAMKMLTKDDPNLESMCRKPDIVADAAHLILSQPSSFTGNFLVDEDVLRDIGGVTDFDVYSCKPGSKKLMMDFFLDFDDKSRSVSGTSAEEKPSSGAVVATFDKIKAMLSPQAVEDVKSSFAFALSGSEPGFWYLDLKSESGSAGSLASDDECSNYEVKFIMSSENFVKMFSGELSPTTAFMQGQLKIKGNAFSAMRLESLMKKTQSMKQTG